MSCSEVFSKSNWSGDFNNDGKVDLLFYYYTQSGATTVQARNFDWFLGSLDNTISQLNCGVAIGNTAGFGNIYDGRPIWIGKFSRTDRSQVLFYYPGDKNWWLGTYDGGRLEWNFVGNTTGFGQVWDGRPFWIGDFNGDAKDDVLFYFPVNHNWHLGRWDGSGLQWATEHPGNSIGNTAGFGNLADSRPIWIGKFSRTDRSQVLFYYPGDKNWWLGTYDGGRLEWNFVGNTTGFGQVWDGRPFWIGDFNGDAKDDVLFYFPVNHNWHLGRWDGSGLQWATEHPGNSIGNTAGFGNLADSRPIWIGKFSRTDRSQVLFYYPGDKNWWLGTYDGGRLEWNFVGNTTGFGQVWDGRPFWIGDFNGDAKDDVLFYFPEDGNWWLGSYDGMEIKWRRVGQSAIIDYAAIYGKTRAAVLSRHFALNRHFRTNYFFGDCDLFTSMTPQELVSKDETTQKIERWRIRGINDYNPLMVGSWLLTCLAIESYLGNTYSLKILKSALVTLSTLYKFRGNNFDGYIIRWDPVCRENWEWGMVPAGGDPPTEMEQLKYSNHFLIGQTGNYLYCAPSTDPRYVRCPVPSNPDLGTWWEFADTFRTPEPSMDELVGLVMGYFIVYHLVKDPTIQSMVKEQVSKLADYLNAHGYILVRPCGGFSARGASGASPVFEYPFNRAFSRITGRSFSYNVSFEDAMRKAKIWKCIEGPMNWGSVGGIAVSAAALILGPVFGIIGLAPAAAVSIITNSAISPIQLGRAIAVLNSKNCFDIIPYETKTSDQRNEFAGAYFFKQITDTKRRFTLWMDNSTSGAGTAWAIGFNPFAALTALDDNDTVVKGAYLNWLKRRRLHNAAHPSDDKGDRPYWGARSCFASAVALLLGEELDEEKILVSLLKERYNELHINYKDDIPVSVPDSEQFLRESVHGPSSALDYMVGLSLAWLYAKRRAARGRPVTTQGFPTIPNNIAEALPKAFVPKEVLRSINQNGIKFRVEDIQNTTSIDTSRDADLFTGTAPEKSQIPVPILPNMPNTQLSPQIDKTIVVKESDRDVDTGITIEKGDVYEFSDVSGTIWAGVVATGRNGPDGWANRVEYDVKFPLHGGMDPVNAHPFCLLGKLNNYFFIGSRGRAKERFIYLRPLKLYLRINDDSPGNGNGEFRCRIRVWKKP